MHTCVHNCASGFIKKKKSYDELVFKKVEMRREDMKLRKLSLMRL